MKTGFTDNDRFELLAEIFMGKFGVMAPGKDDPTSDEAEDEKRRQLWAAWKPLNDVLDCLLYERAERDDVDEQIRDMERRL